MRAAEGAAAFFFALAGFLAGASGLTGSAAAAAGMGATELAAAGAGAWEAGFDPALAATGFAAATPASEGFAAVSVAGAALARAGVTEALESAITFPIFMLHCTIMHMEALYKEILCAAITAITEDISSITDLNRQGRADIASRQISLG